MSLLSTGNDQGQLSLAQAIRSAYSVTNVFADAWSPPAFMKTNDSTDNGGTLVRRARRDLLKSATGGKPTPTT